jgi:hypothetical protein
MASFYPSFNNVDDVNTYVLRSGIGDTAVLPSNMTDLITQSRAFTDPIQASVCLWAALIRNMDSGGNRLGCALALTCLELADIKIDTNADAGSLKVLKTTTPDLEIKLSEWISKNRI